MTTRGKIRAGAGTVTTIHGEELPIEDDPEGFATAGEYFAFVERTREKYRHLFDQLSLDSFIREKREEAGRE